MDRMQVASEVLGIARMLVSKGDVPEEFKKEWKNNDKDNDGKTNEPKPDFLKDKKSAAPKSVSDLPKAEQDIARKMKAKGYNYVVQIVTQGGNFGEPMYFKSADKVGPFLRGFPDYENAKTAWSLSLDELE